MGVAAVAASGFFLTLAITQPALPARSYAGVVLRAAINEAPPLPGSDVPGVLPATAAPAGAPQRLRQQAHRGAAFDASVGAAASSPITAAPGTERTGHALTRFLVGNGRYRVEPFPTVTPDR